ncbi:translation initiation factor IF-2 [bacterium]|nr:translation initiation factor IF-2 [bacterium]
MKVYELAKELDVKALDLIGKIKPLKLDIKNHMSSLSDDQVVQIKEFLVKSAEDEAPAKKAPAKKKAAKKTATKTAKTTKKAAGKTAVKKKAVVRRKASDDAEAAKDAEAPASAIVRRKVIVRREGSTVDEPSTEEASISADSKGADNTSETLVEAAAVDTSVEVTQATPIVDPSKRAPTEDELDPLLAKDDDMTSELASEFTEEMFSTRKADDDDDFAGEEEAEAVAAEEAPVEAPAPSAGSRYSVIRVVSPTTATRDRPLIVSDVQVNRAEIAKNLARTAKKPIEVKGPSQEALLKEIEKDDGIKKKKSALATRSRAGATTGGAFKSTDFLRRERIYNPRKKKLLIGKSNMNKTNITTPSARKRVVEFNKEISVDNISSQMAVKSKEIARKLVKLGLEIPEEAEGVHDWFLDLESAQILASEYDFEVKDVTQKESIMLSARDEVDGATDPRSPVITIMGHVDHGKTSLLDLIRRARVASGEAGGITQHIGAYTVNVDEAINNLTFAAVGDDPEAKKAAKKAKKEAAKKPVKGKASDPNDPSQRLCFLDTPGHAAFSAIRSRGAQCTDIVILVVAASEGVMPQTREAIDHSKAAGVPMIVAMNKMDLPDANPDKLRQQLSEVGVIDEAWGGDTIFVPVSAKTGEGVDKLLEMIQLQAELLELKARNTGPGDGIVIEAKLDKNRGPLATVLVQNGRMKVGDYIAAGEYYGKVRALIDDKGKNTKEAGPSTPVEIMGLSGVPAAGDEMNVVKDERSAREITELRIDDRKKTHSGPQMNSVEDIFALMAMGDLKELPIVLKADARGSAEAIQGSLAQLPQNKVKLKILSAGVGGISESDVLLASASKAIVMGFNVRPDGPALAASEKTKIPIKTYTIIYQLIDEVANAMKGLLEPTIKDVVQGTAEVRQVFSVSKTGAVAGCMVTSGKIKRSDFARVVRDGRVVFSGTFSGLRRFKDDAKEVATGFECGMSIENYNDIKEGDIIESYIQEKLYPNLDGEFSNKASSNETSANS